ncbi:anti-sigma factor antagonist [Anabaena sp. UHCC 0451]|uniref:anti-sigma factor antagonist n=1 Tax=Anabaena sp. UHCC 0451 TaxID=2055235 RepID=UPI002B213A2C|nr:anti-sigma factor antagonist [Anabaena sp. UHCC 0451]MEA5574976.1 anti-sigma factor antagonist [Anabaena sp. UHCC 0451]
MALDVTLEISDDIAKITLAGELDASTASIFKTKVEEAAAQHPKRLVLMMQDLDFMASAGLRVLIFAKQQMGKLDIYVVGAQKDTVLETITKTGFHHSVYLLDEYDAAKIEKV